jgi:hypothetical protein
VLCAASVIAQAGIRVPRDSRRVSLPRTADGHLDLQGIWNYGTTRPLERTKEIENRAFFTPTEAAEFARVAQDRENKELPEVEQTFNSDTDGSLATRERGPLDPSLRTSILTDPPNGKLPPLTPQAKAQKDAVDKSRTETFEGPEARYPSERCLPDVAGPPLVPQPYNNLIQIVQTSKFGRLISHGNDISDIPG